MPKIILTIGLPASGKSTWAKEQVQKYPALYKRVNKDDLRAMIDNGGWSKERERFILRIRNQIIRESLIAGYSVIVDDTNFHPKHLETMQEIAKDYKNVEIEIKRFDTSLLECIQRDRTRENSVGEKVILGMWKQYIKKDYTHSSGLPEAILCDIDGTIAQMNGRSPYEEDKVSTDKPVQEIIDILQTYKRAKLIKIIIMSGRHEDCKKDTEAWLKQCGVPYDEIYMRPSPKPEEIGKEKKDNIIKEELFNRYVRGRYNVKFVLDDRDQVVTLWRSLGLKCLQVEWGNF